VIVAAGIISTAQFVSIIGSVSPIGASDSLLWNVFLSAFISFSCIFGIGLYALRRKFRRMSGTVSLIRSVRQAALGSAVFLLSLFFNTLGILQTWEVIPLIIAAVLIEFFFQAEKRPHATIRYE
jgi:hypothetical protein